MDFHTTLERNRDLEKEILYLRTKNHDLMMTLKESESQKHEMQQSLMNAETMNQRRELFIKSLEKKITSLQTELDRWKESSK